MKLLGEGILNPFHSYSFDASTSKRCPEPGEGLQISRRNAEMLCKGIPAIAGSTPSGAQLKYLCPNAHNMRAEGDVHTCRAVILLASGRW